jgi:hypothetical protein
MEAEVQHPGMKPESASFHVRNYFLKFYCNIILIFLNIKLCHVSAFKDLPLHFGMVVVFPIPELCVQPILTFLLHLCSDCGSADCGLWLPPKYRYCILKGGYIVVTDVTPLEDGRRYAETCRARIRVKSD